MKQLIPISCLAALVSALGAGPAGADPIIGRNPFEWEATLDFDGALRKTNGQDTEEFDLDEGIRIRQRGFILDPRIATLSGGVHFIFQQGKINRGDVKEDRNGQLTNYDLNLSLLHGTSHGAFLTARASRNSNTLDTNLGARSDTTFTDRQVAIHSKNKIFPATLKFAERKEDTLFRSAFSDIAFERNNTLRQIAFDGRSSKLSISAERNWFDNRTAGEDKDFNETRVISSHHVDWGKGSYLNTFFSFWDRNGFRPRQQLSVDERMRLRHSSKLSSRLGYRYNKLVQDNKSESHTGSFELNHDLFGNLSTRSVIYGSWLDGDTRKENEYEARFETRYDKEDVFKFGGDVTARAAVGYGKTDRSSLLGLSEVAGEEQTVPASGVILLDQRFASAITIVVTNESGTIVYTEGADYQVIEAGGGFTEINIIFGGQISIGQTLLIDYSFETLPSAKFSSIPYEFDIRIDIGRFTLSHRLRAEEQSLIGGMDDGSLLDRKDVSSMIEARFNYKTLRSTFSAERRVFDTGAFSSREFSFSQNLIQKFSPKLRVTINANQRFVRSSERTIRLYTTTAQIFWTPTNQITVRPFMSSTIRRDRATAFSLLTDVDETFTSTGLEVIWKIRKLELRSQYKHDKRSGTRINTVEDRLMIHLVRKF